MKGVKFIVPAIILIGVVVFQSLFIVQEISQAIVLQFGDPKKIVAAITIINGNKIFPAFINLYLPLIPAMVNMEQLQIQHFYQL